MPERPIPGELVGERPSTPSSEVLLAASEAIGRIRGTSATPEWTLVRRQERPRSTIFVLDAKSGADVTRVYSKTEHVVTEVDGSTRPDKLSRMQRSLEIEEELAQPLTRAFGSAGIRFDQPLAVRPDLMTAARLGIPGAPLGRASWHAVPWRRASALERYASIGRAIRLVESVGRLVGPALSVEECWAQLNDDVTRAEAVLGPTRRHAAMQAVDQLVHNLDPQTCSAWTHGDVSRSNVLIDGKHLGLIDFSWRPVLAGRDVAQLLMRVRGERIKYRPWVQQVSAAILGGYGLPADDAAWRLAYLQRLLRSIRQRQENIHGFAWLELRSYGIE